MELLELIIGILALIGALFGAGATLFAKSEVQQMQWPVWSMIAVIAVLIVMAGVVET